MDHPQETEALLSKAQAGIQQWLEAARDEGRIDEQSYQIASSNTYKNLCEWYKNDHIPTFSPAYREGVANAINNEEWTALVNAYRQYVRFGTGGIRGMMAFDRDSIVSLKENGFNAPILKGPNTINEILLLRTSSGVAKYGQEQPTPFQKVVIGYDSRIRGFDFAKIIAELFLAYGYTVYFFDEPCPYPEVTYAIPSDKIKADVGILISASHNDYRYNGYKLSCGNGSQFDPKQRDEMYEQYIAPALFENVKLCPFAEAGSGPGKLISLGGDERLDSFDYTGFTDHINIHEAHANHVQTFLFTKKEAREKLESSKKLNIGYCAFHGVGRKAVPRILQDVGFPSPKAVTHNGLNDLNGLFPSFESDPGREQQPDPGDERAARIAVAAFQHDFPGEFDDLDILIGTDPDADRCGVVVKVPEEQREIYGQNWILLPADEMWALLLWYRLDKEQEGGSLPDADKKFMVQSHTTSDGIIQLARKYGLGAVKTWVGFAALSAAVRDVWNNVPAKNLVGGREVDDAGKVKDPNALCDSFVCDLYEMKDKPRSFNVAAMEQSNGFSLLGGPPADDKSLGVDGHVRDKDGTLAAVLTAEVAEYAKQQNKTIIELLDQHVYLDPDVGLFVTGYEPDPLDGEYPGIEGDQRKITILGKALEYEKRSQTEALTIGGMKILSTCIYRTGKYDHIYPPTAEFQFPDEGIRFFLSEDNLNHVTIRPSGTGNSLRFHVQLHSDVTAENLLAKKQELRETVGKIIDNVREILDAPRGK